MPFRYVKNKINEIGYYEIQNESFIRVRGKTSWNDDLEIELAKTKGNAMPLVRSKSFDFGYARKLPEP